MKTKRGHHVTRRRTKPRAVDMRPGVKPIRFEPSDRMKFVDHAPLENRLPL